MASEISNKPIVSSPKKVEPSGCIGVIIILFVCVWAGRSMGCFGKKQEQYQPSEKMANSYEKEIDTIKASPQLNVESEKEEDTKVSQQLKQKIADVKKNYIKELRTVFLDEGLDVRCEEINGDLVLKYSLFNEVWYRKLQRLEPRFYGRGYFKKVIITDGDGYTSPALKFIY